METMEMTPSTTDAGNASIPQGWKKVRIRDVTQMGTGHTPSTKKPSYYGDDVMWISLQDTKRLDNHYINETTVRISEEGLRNCSAVRLPKDTVAVLRTGNVGKVAILGQIMAVSQDYVTWTCGKDVLPEFLYYVFQGLKPGFEQQANGSTVRTLGLPFFEKLHILLPSLSEQKQIVAVLKSLDKAVTSTQDLLIAKRTYKRGLMQQLLMGQRRFPEFQGQPWQEVKLGQVFGKKSMKNVGNRVSLVITVGKYAIRPQLSHFNRSVASSDLSAYNVIEPGDFVYDPMSAYYGAIGRYDLTEAGVVSPVYRVLTIQPGFDSDFAKQLLKSPYILGRLDNASTQGNKEGKRRGLQDGAFNTISFQCPPLLEQQRIAAVLTACDQEIELLQAQLRQWQQQKKGMMQQLLTGQLRVPLA